MPVPLPSVDETTTNMTPMIGITFNLVAHVSWILQACATVRIAKVQFAVRPETQE
jgi:hypothetical protein